MMFFTTAMSKFYLLVLFIVPHAATYSYSQTLEIETKKNNCENCVVTNSCPPILDMINNAKTTEDIEKIRDNFFCKDLMTVCCPEYDENSYERNLKPNGYFVESKDQCCDSIDNDNVAYTYGGEITKKNEFPSLALLEYEGSNETAYFECGSSLINNFYVLTAAHCVTGKIINNYGKLKNVRLGDNDLSVLRCENENCRSHIKIIPVAEIIPHEEFSDEDRNRHHDIALIRLSIPVQYSEIIKPICMPWIFNNYSSDKNDIFTVAGWGRTLLTIKSIISMKVNVPRFDHDECVKKYARIKVNITDYQICAGGEFKKDACDGDSGGPLVIADGKCSVQSGIVSFGRGCGLEDWPAIYTNVYAYKEWILKNLKG